MDGSVAGTGTDVNVPADVARYCRAAGPLESPLIWLAFAAAALVLVVVAVRWRRARRRAVIAAVCCALVAGLTGLNTYVGYVRTGHDLAALLERGGGPAAAVGRLLDGSGGGGDGSGGRGVPADADAPALDSFDLADPADGVPTGRMYVLLPPGYASSGQAYPVVYLVHGYPFGSAQDWLTAGAAPGALDRLYRDGAIPPMILVSVDLTAGQSQRDWEGLDVPGGPRLETFLTGPVVSAVDGRYRTIRDRAARALGGMSGGAFAALNTGLHHTGEFGVLLLTLPYDTPGDVRDEFHGDRAAIERNTPRDYLTGMVFHDPVAVFLAAGSHDGDDVDRARDLAGRLTADGQQAVVHVEPGLTHTWRTARATLPYMLVFAGEHFPAG
ncbi:alpha/beta hydrolase [Amycolatopsis thermophila]|uniref:Enterochelin esterase-like enzyme n=1 Tax=Amycolatopsis thermophila TaxID=206084 RepID=A0ABU0F654_9PSEU|nr:alpha/beta hydrolase-fold protein [Amycolatopsis thermophila]MDQ0383070.1 enterochelin esterase-like enzyme [Amycolatopsis thermophila]